MNLTDLKYYDELGPCGTIASSTLKGENKMKNKLFISAQGLPRSAVERDDSLSWDLARGRLLDALLVVREESLLLAEDNEELTSHISSESGIRFAVEHYLLDDINHQEWEAVADVMHSLFLGWPCFSGEASFPICGEYEYMTTENLWIGESGKLRRELLDYMISELSQ